MMLIGLTGGIGAGKSTVAARFAQLGAVVIDADAVARQIVEPATPALADIVKIFGNAVLHDDGTLNRRRLGGIVFGDPAKLAQLNAITHPRVRAEVSRRIAEAPRDAVVVYDVPLLVEAEVDHPFDYIVVVEAPRATRIDRLVSIRGMTPEDARARIDAQADDASRRRIADTIITTDGSLADTRAQVDKVWSSLRSA